MRLAIVDRDKCTKDKCGYVCQKVCPGVRMGDETIVVDTDGEGFPFISEKLCTGCGICVKKCPAGAIKIINLADEVGKPIFQYAANSFRLYGLPLPQPGVVSLVGRNGIGKSTALKLLSGGIRPNFGDYKHDFTDAELFKNLSIAQRGYFEKLKNKQLKVSYKPQNVDKLGDAFKGKKVKALLKAGDEGKRLEEAVELFELFDFLDRDISELSGGELQRVAIAASWLKNADIYYFDEPTSYLDIEQRMKIAKVLKSLAEKKSVLAVEHDLAVLDYLSEYVFVFYGTEAAYGVVSGLKGVRAGINEYLDGYLREENVKFRDYGIRFDNTMLGSSKAKVKMKYDAMKKKFKNFKFESEEGVLHEGEVIGIMGRNAIGKTLFIKMLAGVEEPDEGTGIPLKISYKPQYIKSGTDENQLVRELFLSVRLEPVVFEECKRRLNLEGLLEKAVSKLSGGELQRVAITLCLAQEADIYLLDEPSAFLDIEQRLHFSHLVKSVIENGNRCAFVVDHDVVLLDSIANRLMVFEGESSKHGKAGAPLEKREGMNHFLKSMDITMRRDRDSLRPRINKPNSALDREQKDAGEYYYYSRE